MMDYDGSAGPLFERVIFAGFPGISPIVSDNVHLLGQKPWFPDINGLV
jgi:hypothetical protein